MGCVFGRQQQYVNNASTVDAAENNVRVVVTTTTTSFAFAGVGDGGAVDVRNCDGGEDSSRVVVERRRSIKRNKTKLNPRLSNIPKHVHGEQVAAGWPSWLSAVAGEAINGWIPRRADTFEKLNKIGQGTYSNVYKARDTLSGKVVALKKVRFDNLEPESVKFMAREILILRRLDHPNVVKLEGLATSRMSCSLYLVFEYMDHDLAGLAASPGIKFTEPQVKCFMHQILSGLEHCHDRHVLHRDIKGSNLLIDHGGVLKIADFGLASLFDPNHKQPLTSRVVTLWYRPPELLLGATDYAVGVDLWSAGCILAELLAGRPIMPGRTEVEQLHKIFKLCGSPSEEYWKKSRLPHATIFKPQQSYKRRIQETFKDFPPSSLPLIETLLAIDPAERQTATAALHSEFFTTKPYACEPSSLPKYPPSKEMDAKLRDEEARRAKPASTVSQSAGVLDVSGKERSATRSLSTPAKSKQVGNVTPIPEARTRRANNAQGKTPASSLARGKKFNDLSSASYWLSQIQHSESAAKHSISLGFFKLALEVGCQPLQQTRDKLKSYARRHDLGDLGESVKELFETYNISENQEQVQVSETCSQVPEEGARSSDEERRRLITHANAKSKSEKFPPPHQDGGFGYPLGSSHHHIDPVFDPPDVPFSSSFSLSKEPIQGWSGPLVNDGHARFKSSKDSYKAKNSASFK